MQYLPLLATRQEIDPVVLTDSGVILPKVQYYLGYLEYNWTYNACTEKYMLYERMRTERLYFAWGNTSKD
jgi:hypothetical protein